MHRFIDNFIGAYQCPKCKQIFHDQPFTDKKLLCSKCHVKLKVKTFEDVHLFKDGPYTVLGPKHRVLFHKPVDDLMYFGGNPDKLLSGLLHDLTDKKASENPRLRLALELIALMT